jgi:hypothetical protein
MVITSAAMVDPPGRLPGAQQTQRTMKLFGFSYDRTGTDAWFHTETAARRFAAACGWDCDRLTIEEAWREDVDKATVLDTPNQAWSRGPGRPPTDGASATAHVHLRVTPSRKSTWVRTAQKKGQNLSDWMTDACDLAAQ